MLHFGPKASAATLDGFNLKLSVSSEAGLAVATKEALPGTYRCDAGTANIVLNLTGGHETGDCTVTLTQVSGVGGQVTGTFEGTTRAASGAPSFTITLGMFDVTRTR